MTKTASRVVAGDGTGGSLTAPQIVAYGLKQGVIAAKDEAAWQTYAAAHPGDALTAVTRRMTAARAVTPAAPVAAGSGASGAGGSADPATAYPSAWSRAVAAAQRVTGSRKAQPVKSAWPTAPSAQVAGTTTQPRSTDGFYDKSVRPSAAAAEQQSRREADLRRMESEQAARLGAQA